MEIFIARQPIFDQRQKVFAYELLFRSSVENVFKNPDPNHASSKVITDSFFLIGVEDITGGKKAFINIPRDLLVDEYVFLLPKETTVVEILETVEPDKQVIEACAKLKRQGYLLALDDFIYDPRYKPLMELADIIKVDFLLTGEEQRKALVDRFAPIGIRLLAEKVETREVFQEALEAGYTYFQGYFFSKPFILTGRDIPGFKLNYLRIIQEINQPELNFEQVEEIIKQEVSLSYKLLRYVNSSFFGFKKKINTIKQALVLLGEREVKKWISLIALANMGNDKPEELVVQAIVRGRFCESLAPLVGFDERSQEMFLMGMFSLLDAIMDRPLPEILEKIPIADDIRGALLGEENFVRDIYECVLLYEKGNWQTLSERTRRLNVGEQKVPWIYLESIRWTRRAFPISSDQLEPAFRIR